MTSKHTRHWVVALSLAIATLASSAWADDSADVSRLIQTGFLPEALQKADSFLTQHPKDAQMRFLKGLILAEQTKTSDAITVFTKLTEDYPELPEPYNNLAVLFASQNQFDKARAALEMAIRTNPAYGTAHENLGDVYAKLASQSYDKALQLDSGNSGAKLKLTLIRNLFTNTNSAIASNSKTKLPTPATAPTTLASNVASVKVAPATAPASNPTPSKSEPKTASKPDTKVSTGSNTEQDDVLKVVDAWANAWSNKNTTSYLAFYGNDFQFPKGLTRKSWSEERRARIEGKGHINVKVESAKVTLDGNTATVRFRQIYHSDQLKADSRKTLVLNKQDGRWQIAQERTGG